jgi:hypothetical protein
MRLARALVVPLLIAVAAPVANAQEEPAVVLRLLRQTTWNTPEDTDFRLEVRAANHGEETLDDLSLGIVIWTPARSRTAYEHSLEADPGSGVTMAQAPPFPGELRPGGRRTFRVRMDLSVLAQRGEDAIYPMTVELRSHDEAVATFRSPVIFLNQEPKVPLDVASTFVVYAPLFFQPGGTFRNGRVEDLVRRGGSIRGATEALASQLSRPGAPSVDVVLSPTLLGQLERMRRGYSVWHGVLQHVKAGTSGARDADAVLKNIRTIAGVPSAEVSAMPLGAPSIPALLHAELETDLRRQLGLGRDETERLTGARISPRILYPPGSRLDQAALYRLWREGIRLVLVDPGIVAPRPQDRGFAEPPGASLTAGEKARVKAVVPDAGVEALLASDLPERDPRLAARAVLGELTSIWLEQPSVKRGVAAIFPENLRLPGSFYLPFIHALSGVPWLHTVKAGRLLALHPPPSEPAELVPRRGRMFSAAYVSELQEARVAIERYSSTLRDESSLPQNLGRVLLLGEGLQFLRDEERGLRFLDSISGRLQKAFGPAKVAPDTSVPVTLTDRTGQIPLAIRNDSGHELRVRVHLVSNRLTFPQGDTKVVQLPEGSIQLTFPVETRTTGRFPVQVLLETPSGERLGPPAQLVVRSTAYNVFALIITLGAAFVLLALWARRFFPWARRS